MEKQARIVLILLFIVAVFWGANLRLHDVEGQIVADDEWHPLVYAINNPLSHILTHLETDANSYLQNLYTKVLLVLADFLDISITETLLRLPQILTGLLALIVFPFFIRDIFAPRVTLLFTFLLAISPVFIYHSRFARFYHPAVFMAFLSIFSFYKWVTERKKRYAWGYVICGIIAYFSHPFAVFAVIAPALYMFIYNYFAASRPAMQKDIQLHQVRDIALPFAFLMNGICLLVFPVLGSVGEIEQWLNPDLAMNQPSRLYVPLVTLKEFSALLSGTTVTPLIIMFMILMCVGIYSVSVRNRFLGGFLVSILGLQFLGVIIFAPIPFKAEALNLGKFFIATLPLYLILVAVGVDSCASKLEKMIKPLQTTPGKMITTLCCLGFVCILYFTGPIPDVYGYKNNFTNHQAFQKYYDSFKWNMPYNSYLYKMSDTEIPVFYRELAADTRDLIIIESPDVQGWDFNLYYYYQHIHKKQVKSGFASYMTREEILGSIESSRLNFTNFVNMHDLSAIKASGASYVFVHTNLQKIIDGKELAELGYTETLYWLADDLVNDMTGYFGAPVFSDSTIKVFRVLPANTE